MWLCIPTTSFPMPSANSQSHTGVSHPIKQISNLPGWDRALSWPCFHPSSCRSPSKTAETPSNVLNQLWETVPTTNPVEILKKRIFYRKGIMKCQMRKETHKLITGRNNFDLSHGSSFQLKLLFLLFVETQWYWRLNQCWFWKISDFQSAHPTLIFICSVVLWENIFEYLKRNISIFRLMYRWCPQNLTILSDARTHFALSVSKGSLDGYRLSPY